ncbi:MAG: hypothetical protein ACREYD_06195, partial [Casimicrobiaceae bacterium]
MYIDDVRISSIPDDRVEVTAMCDGRSLHYRIPASHFRPQAVGDALLISTLAPAMRAMSPLHLPSNVPVSSRLVEQLDGIQRIYAGWNAGLKQVRLDATLYEPMPSDGPAGLFYAGGVDSSYSLLTHLEDVDLLIIVFGFDHTLAEDEAAANLKRNSQFAQRFGKVLIPVETNHSRFVRELGVSRTFVHGATLASIALLLGLSRCFIASSHATGNVRPDGSHPLLDHRFSNGVTEIIHDDISVTRLQKTWTIAKHADVLANLRVCWEFPNENCGACPKCLRTMIALRLCGSNGPFPTLKDVGRIRAMAARSEVEYVVDLLMAAHAQGDAEAERELKKGLRIQDWKEALRFLDRALAGGALRGFRRWRRDTEIGLVKVELRPDLDLQ